MRCITANVLQTKVDAQCHKLATELSWQRLRRTKFSSYSELLSEVANFNLLHMYLAPSLGYDPVWILPTCLATENYSSWAIVWRCLRLAVSVEYRLGTGRQRDRQTHLRHIYRASVASRDKKKISFGSPNLHALKLYINLSMSTSCFFCIYM